MNEQLQQALLDFIQKANQGVNFAVDQLPDALKDRMGYEATACIGYVIGFAALISLLLYISIRVYRAIKRRDNAVEDDFGLWVISGACLLVAFAMLFPLYNYAAGWVHVTFYPKSWILEYVRSFR